ncbi:GDSL-type esterase/lipase family protein [Sulfurimonas sp.]
MSFILLALFFSLVLVIVYQKNSNDINGVVLKEDSVILAFGDSLTNGFGAGYEFSYPKYMERKTGLKVINAGVDGEFSYEGLARLPKLLKHKPDLVILCHGGNDILNKLSSEELKSNLLAMVRLIQNSGAKVLLVGVPDFSLFSFSTHDIYGEVADETDILLEDEVLTHIELNRSLKSDYVHPNEKGYEKMADAFIEVLKLKI